ncbi:MAG: ChaN family lipoprotein, partial [Paracoccaceae bacterium]
ALGPKALVFEMLTPEQAAMMPVDRSDPVALAAALGWDSGGWPDFSLYYPIFTAAPGARVFGANIPREAVGRAMEIGSGAVFGPDAGLYGLNADLAPADQATREADQMQAHCNALPAEMLPGMVAGQRLRDAALARAVVQAMAATGGPVAVITGNGHARRDQGMVVPLTLAAPQLRVLSVGQLEDDPGADAPFDLWIVTQAAVREDPCLGFAPKKS